MALDANSPTPTRATAGACQAVREFSALTTSHPSGHQGTFPSNWRASVTDQGRGTGKADELGMARLVRANRVLRSGAFLAYKRFLDDFPAQEVGNLWTDTGTGSFTNRKSTSFRQEQKSSSVAF